ncbi:hypothetical protein IPA_09740 [Ignicoccus pacificus DSM 13166]|uniref:AAA domain-containing protein n=1 Tax=Ignicoccus pacificus DSM 13166 TaxID=940294 RepID=A0A977PM34_9CREN|nr:hypothetical protein IPA_09740 [Ignicoccus pacificus DSM 13166]
MWGIKGGVGKSTTSALISASAAAKAKRRVLLIDADFRDGASRFFLGEEARNLKGWYDVLEVGGELDKFIHTLYNGYLHVIPSGTIESAIKYSAEIAEHGIEYAAKKVAETLFTISEYYDLIVMDTPAASFADIPILKCVISSLDAKSVLLSQASIVEIERTLKVAEVTMGFLPKAFVINQVNPRTIADPNERRMLINEVLNITSRKIKTLVILFMTRLYRRIDWGSLEVNMLLDCIAYLLWKKGRGQACMTVTRGLLDMELVKAIAEIEW